MPLLLHNVKAWGKETKVLDVSNEVQVDFTAVQVDCAWLCCKPLLQSFLLGLHFGWSSVIAPTESLRCCLVKRDTVVE